MIDQIDVTRNFRHDQLHPRDHEVTRALASRYLENLRLGVVPAYPQALEQVQGLRAAYNTLCWCGIIGSSDCAILCQSLVEEIQGTML
jgi:hypothetical protein